jgi:signal transduction histidine kinase
VTEESDREAWARALHDETLQGLAAARITIDMALRADSPEAMRPQLKVAAEQISREVEAIRKLIERISPGAG